MFKKIKDMIYGFNEYEKVKIEHRFEKISQILHNIEIKNLEEFEILEDSIYKIKELLRIKSSNLNNSIRKNQIKKKNIQDLLLILTNIRFEFLNKAFIAINEKEKYIKKNEYNKEKQIISDNHTFIDEIDIENNLNFNDNILFENLKYKITLENEKVLYIKVEFKEEIHYNILKTLSAILFEIYKCDGTNIIIEKNIAKIISRFNNDNLFFLEKKNINIEKVYEQIKNKSNFLKKSETNYDTEYITIEEEKKTIKDSLKEKEDSLDNLLNNLEKKKKHPIYEPSPEKENKIQFIEEEPNEKKIEIEKEEKKTNNDDFIIEKTNDSQLIIYEDEKIKAILDKNASVFGKLDIISKENNKIKNLNEGDISYMMIFAKVFTSILFESLQSSGTNLIWNHKGNKISIIARQENDNVDLKLIGKKSSTEFLEQVKNKLLSKMHEEINNNDNKNKANKPNIENEEIVDNDDSNLKEKAEYLLESLRKIP
jgi:hypothetical protein